MIERPQMLQAMALLAIDIQEGESEQDIVTRDAIAEQTRSEASRRLSALFAHVAEREETAAKAAQQSVARVAQQAARAEGLVQEVLATVASILDDLLSGELLVGMTALKTANAYAFQHGIDAGVTAALIGRKIWLSSAEQYSLVAGSLVMDIGTLTVPRALLEKPGELTPDEQAQVRQHTTAGFEMLRQMRWEDTLSKHIPYQHHERQDGGGYPRGLRGTNRARRTRREELDGALILQLAEVAAIADVYDALLSDRPYRRALPLDEAVATVRAMAGPALNAEMVDAFLALVPRFQLGMRVRLEGGGFAGALAMVVDQDDVEPERPVVRLLAAADRPAGDAPLATVDRPEIVITAVTAAG